MHAWSAEIKELENIHGSLKEKLPNLEKELARLIKADDENIVLLYSRRCLEVIITDLCECELKRPRKTEPLKGIIDKLNREEKVPPHIIASMHGLNTLSTFGAHPKDYDPEQVKPVLNNLTTIIKWYLKGKDIQPDSGIRKEEEVFEHKNQAGSFPEKSIIVLPFENMSPDPDQEYFSDGLTEEIITDLSYIPGLLVISRNSTMTFKGTRKKTAEIAREVNVKYVLEGSVRKSANKIRITAQLIDALTDTHIWANKYDGTLDDIFDIQEKVSISIANSLKIKLNESQQRQIAEKSFEDPFVYEIYLKAKYEDWQFNEASFRRGEELLNQGLKLAGDNHLFYSELSHVTIQYVNNLMKDPDTYPELIEKAYKYAEKAVSLNPFSATAYTAKALARFQSCNIVESYRNFRKAIEVEPNYNDPILPLLLGYLYAATGLDMHKSELMLERCRVMDPLTPVSRTSHGWRLIYLGKFKEAVEEFNDLQHVMEQIKTPTSLWFAWFHGLNKNYIESFRIIDNLVADHPDHIMASLGRFMKYSWLKDRKTAIYSVTESLEKAAWWDDAYSMNMAEGYSMLKEYDKAFRWLNRAIDYGITNIPFLTQYDHFLENLRKDERFETCIQKARGIIESLKELN
jgi:TolB-like protein/TPR repeat protein